MPELPEVETTRRGLLPVLVGRTLARVEARRPDLRFPLPPDFVERLEGRRIDAIDRRAKYILIRLEGDLVWLIHLGMAGRLVVGEAATPFGGRHDHVVVYTDEGGRVTFTDARRFGFMDLIDGDPATSRHLRSLGLEPLGSELTGPVLTAVLAGRKTSLKAALLDQRLIAGLGNIYVCEALNRARLSPFRTAGTVTGARAARLATAIRETLGEAIEAGGSSLRDYVQASGELGYFQHRWRVYGREGEPCRIHANTTIRRKTQAGRSTFYCAACQR